ncbi:septum formation initiator family protein [Bacillus altitudinis MN12]|uniref:Cell division protein DIVIC n=4 Tax=Bacillus TaxID=1386 RepID=A0AAC9IG42_9BACI|nr:MULTISPECIES: septum formation initiator family protein [Bacillus]AHL69968.1 cell division protein DIVIC [Bacillus pumilus]EMI15142.1 cell-division initiation protein [Bacillus stratosphericus LAMA 585]KML02653.1 cell division protein DIVIC [Bacillus stratosphericus]KQL41732.1 cell division protein DIVIC [Bacillus sp. FJAT-21955]MBR3207594.1 septum formation initiator family protein [Bacillus sp. (in: firmicutes)]MBW3702311.1 septum formation initiator family protein [Bacillus aerophilus]
MNERKRNIAQIQNDYQKQMEQQAQRLKRKRRGLLRRLTVFGVIVLMFAVLVTSALWSQSSALKEKEEKKVALEKELKQLQTKQEDISDEIKKLKSKEYVLELARRDYYMSKKGEKIFDVGNKSD